MSGAERARKQQEKAQKNRLHQQNLQAAAGEDDDSSTAEILRYLAEIDDLPIDTDDPVMGQLVSKLSSTANLTPEQVKSNEWVREYLLILYLCKHPRPDGMHTETRAWAHDDVDAYREPLDPSDRAALESFIASSKLALTRSEDMEAVKESTRTVKESITHDESSSGGSGGILGKLGIR